MSSPGLVRPGVKVSEELDLSGETNLEGSNPKVINLNFSGVNIMSSPSLSEPGVKVSREYISPEFKLKDNNLSSPCLSGPGVNRR